MGRRLTTRRMLFGKAAEYLAAWIGLLALIVGLVILAVKG